MFRTEFFETVSEELREAITRPLREYNRAWGNARRPVGRDTTGLAEDQYSRRGGRAELARLLSRPRNAKPCAAVANTASSIPCATRRPAFTRGSAIRSPDPSTTGTPKGTRISCSSRSCWADARNCQLALPDHTGSPLHGSGLLSRRPSRLVQWRACPKPIHLPGVVHHSAVPQRTLLPEYYWWPCWSQCEAISSRQVRALPRMRQRNENTSRARWSMRPALACSPP